MRGSCLLVRWIGSIAVVAALLVPSQGVAADDGGCARKVLDPYLAALQGWQVNAFEAEKEGARMVLEQKGEPQYLLIALALEGTRLHTFVSVHGKSDDSAVPEAISTQLNAQWDKLWQDPAARSCDRLAIAAAPVSEEWYKKLEALYLSLQPAPPLPGPEGVGGVPGTESSTLPIVLTIAFFAVLVVLAAILVLRRRARKIGPASAPVPPTAPEAPAAPDTEPPAKND